jgi:predicted phosphodiesterase
MAEAGLLDALAAFPSEQRATLADGTRLLGIHASPRSDDGAGISPKISDPDLAALVTGANADIVCGGHTHCATDRVIGGTRAVNLGSVSNPMTDDPRASYVVVADDRHGHALSHRRVAYDHDAVVARIDASGHPDAAYLASFQRGTRR